MSTTTHRPEQRFPGAGLARVTIEAGNRDVAVAWREGDDVCVAGGDVEVTTLREELVIAALGRGGRVAIDLPAGLPACAITVRHGDLTLTEARGRLDVEARHGDLRLHRGQGEATLKLGRGDAAVEDFAGPLRVMSGAGDLRLDRVDGPLSAHTGSGDVGVRGGAGEASLKSGAGDVLLLDRAADSVTVSSGRGDVRIDGGRAGRTVAQTGAGDLSCTARLGLGSHQFTTGAGDLTVAIPRDLPARLEVSTALGDIRSDPPLVSVGQRGPKGLFSRRLVGSLGEGGERADISLRTGRGDVRLIWHGQAGPGASAFAEAGGTGRAGFGEIMVDVDSTVSHIGSAIAHVGSTVARVGSAMAGFGAGVAGPAPAEGAPRADEPPAMAMGPAGWSAPDGPSAPPPVPDAPAAPAPPPATPTDPAAEQRAILAALAKGELTVDEAERLLAALEARQ